MQTTAATEDVRTFRAGSMAEALLQVKRELGPDAVILGTRSVNAPGVRGLAGRTEFEITASRSNAVPPRARPNRTAAVRDAYASATPRHADAAAAPASDQAVPRQAAPARVESPSVSTAGGQAAPEGVDQRLLPYLVRLKQSEVAEQLADRIVREACGSEAPDSPTSAEAVCNRLRATIARSLPAVGGIDWRNGERCVAAFVGPPGAGKTTTLAKLAAHFRLRHKRRVGLLSLDMHRMGTNVQLQRYAQLLHVPFCSTQTVQGVRDALGRLADEQIVLIDTPGIAARDRNRLARLSAMLRCARAHETHLVLPASFRESVLQRAAEAFKLFGVSRVVLTRLDEAVGFGVILNTMSQLEWALSYTTDGQNVPHDIYEADSNRLAELILPAGG